MGEPRNPTTECYAHSLEGKPRQYWQRLHDHLHNVAESARRFATAFDSGEWAHHAGWLHDLGKADPAFQAYLCRENGLDDAGYDDSSHGRVNHSCAGAALAIDSFEKEGPILAYLAAGHHAGLPDWYSSDTGNAALSVRLDEGRENLTRLSRYIEDQFPKLPPLPRHPVYVRPENVHLWLRLLYSCLVDADFLDTEAFMNPDQYQIRTAFGPIAQLKECFDRHMEQLAKSASDTPVNRIRKEILATCRKAAEDSPGLYSLTVPTGGGKTLSGMAYALDHAVLHRKDRIIYVIPYTSIIEQTAEILAGIFGPENIIEHHSNLNPDKETMRSRLAAENWDAPIIVTTNVQFFESLYAAKSSRCRKLHNIVNSVVILDEAQLLPPNLLAPCIDTLNQLTRHFGVTLLLSTATQPALSTLPAGYPRLDPPREIIPDPADLYARLRRTTFLFPAAMEERLEWNDLVTRLLNHDQVLCIVNTRRDCHDLYNQMPPDTIHLSALMCGEHRSRIIAAIKKRLKEGLPVRVISTQLVEAGVDMDFPVVYRAMAGLDAIAQAAGRCNREGGLNADGRLGEVHIFNPPTPAPRGMLRKGEDTTRELCAISAAEPDRPETFSRYFNLLYARLNDMGKGFSDWLVKDADDLKFHFRTAAKNFHMIDDQAQRSVFVRYGDNDQLLRQLSFAGPKRDIMRRLQRYSVNIPQHMASSMLADGLLEEIWPGFLAQAMSGLYDESIGLQVYRENLPVEDLVI